MKKISILFIFSTFIFTNVLFAQEINNPSNIGNCFEYYNSNSIKFYLITDNINYFAGDPVLIQGSVKNKNKYPVIDVDINARIVKKINPLDSSMNGEIIIDEIDLAKNLTLDSDKEFRISYSYLLPLNASSGQYDIYLYAIENDKFNLATELYSQKLQFEVLGEQQNGVYLDQSSIKIDNQKYDVSNILPNNNLKSEIPIDIVIKNTHNKDVEMNVTWQLYFGDSSNEKNKLSTKTEKVKILAKSDKILNFAVDNVEFPSYYLSVSAEPADTTLDDSVYREKSISNIRFDVSGLSYSKLDFVGVDNYPLKIGEDSNLVTCFHDMGNIIEPNISRIETIIKDENGKEITKTSSEISVTQDVVGMIKKFRPSKNISEFTILSTIYDKENKIIDSVEKKYSCKDINPDVCIVEKTGNELYKVLIAIVLFILVISGLSFLRKRKLINILKN